MYAILYFEDVLRMYNYIKGVVTSYGPNYISLENNGIGFLIYVGVIGVQYLTWASVGAKSVMNGVFSRYFIPLLMFIPFIINTDFLELDMEKLSLIFLTIAISFISGMIMLTVAVKY